MSSSRTLLAVVGFLLVLNIVGWLALISRGGDPGQTPVASPSRRASSSSSAPVPSASASLTPSASATNSPEATSTAGQSIEIDGLSRFAKPFETVRITGSLAVSGVRTTLNVQRQRRGTWASFPLPVMTDSSGDFTAYLELGVPGRYRVRVIDPASGAASNEVTLYIR